MIAASTIDYAALGTGLAVAFIAFMQVYGSWKQRQIAKTVEVIHTLTNSQMGLVLLNLAKSTALNYSLESTELNKAEAEKALAAYNDHVLKQAAVDSKAKP